ncbi:MAG: hypothetical protein R3B70_26940, partial [Polyangiaceae bacterium]
MGILLAGAVALVVWKTGPQEKPEVAAADAGADGDAESDASAEPASSGDPDAGAPQGEDAGEPEPGTARNDAGATLLNGEAPPTLANDAPKLVVFGVILVQYKGAQAAPPNARSREDALVLAKQLAEEAKTDFKAAVGKGDPGSVANAGRMPRGMLEAAPEFVLFSLAKGAVSEPVDT